EAAEKVQGAGGQVVTPPFDVPQAGRMAVFTDPEGAAFNVWQAREHKGARIVNEPGSLNFNNLNSRDPEGAKRFYGSVFGWETLPMTGGAQAWRLPGYGDYLEARTPGMRQGMADMGAPAGFEDVVATLMPLADDAPAHWSVTFAVDDADGTAERAAQLGGQVVVPPIDAPWVRMTVISDPQGATFVASKVVPENKDLGNQSDPAVSAAYLPLRPRRVREASPSLPHAGRLRQCSGTSGCSRKRISSSEPAAARAFQTWLSASSRDSESRVTSNTPLSGSGSSTRASASCSTRRSRAARAAGPGRSITSVTTCSLTAAAPYPRAIAGGLESIQMAKTWVLDSETKGTGARMVPLEDVLEKPKPTAPSPPPGRTPAGKPAGTTRPKRPVEKRS